MLDTLVLKNLGPFKYSGPVSFGRRINLLTGSNGLGKSLLLDAVRLAFTGTMSRQFLISSPSAGETEAVFTFDSCPTPVRARFSPTARTWDISGPTAPLNSAVIVFDDDDRSSFSVCGPTALEGPGNLSYRDWITWQNHHTFEFEQLSRALAAFSVPENPPLTPGRLMKTGFSKDVLPSVIVHDGTEVPLPLASDGLRRIVGLAYALVRAACASPKTRAEHRSFVIIADDIESHLHPNLQRRILPALIDTVRILTEGRSSVQIFASTHSPLVTASVEPLFDGGSDALFTLKPCGSCGVSITKTPRVRQGTVSNWLVSESFGLRQARSLPAERAVDAANALMRGDTASLPEDLNTSEKVNTALRCLLPDHDEFWPRWLVRSGQSLQATAVKKP